MRYNHCRLLVVIGIWTYVVHQKIMSLINVFEMFNELISF